MALTHKKPNRTLLRTYIWLYRWILGWMMGGRFLLLTHIRRKSGLKHQTVIEIVNHKETTGAYYDAAAWWEKLNWYRNIQHDPTVDVQVRHHKFQADAEQISTQEAEERLWDYSQKYPTAFGELVTIMLGESLLPVKETSRTVTEFVPLISLTPIG